MEKNSDTTHDGAQLGSGALVQPWWIKVPWQNYDESGECPQCVRCGVSMKLNSSDSEWGEDDDAIFNICNSCAASLLPEMWQRLNDLGLARAEPGIEQH
jgi:hypothetical protein